MSVYKRGRIYWTKFRVNGVLYRISLETSSWHESLRREKTRSVASAGKLRSDRGEFASLPFDQALEQHLVEVAPYQAVGTRKTQSWHGRPLAAFFGRTPVRKIDEESLRQYVAQRVAAGRANGTINQETHVLRGVLKRARRWGLVGDEFRQLPETSRPGRVMTHDEKVRFLKVAASNARWERAYCAAVLAFNTSMRSAEIKGLRWRQVDWMNETLTVRRETTKTDKGERLIPLNQEAR
jgi:integrase